jgi:hypothetical protein
MASTSETRTLNLDEVLAERIDWRYKSFPPGPPTTIREVRSRNWNVLGGEFMLPVMVLTLGNGCSSCKKDDDDKPPPAPSAPQPAPTTVATVVPCSSMTARGRDRCDHQPGAYLARFRGWPGDPRQPAGRAGIRSVGGREMRRIPGSSSTAWSIRLQAWVFSIPPSATPASIVPFQSSWRLVWRRADRLPDQ